MILAALAVLIIVAAVNSGKNRYTDELDILKDKWGKLGDTQYPSDDFENISHYYRLSENDGYSVDDITWNDLEMDSIFQAIDNCSSSIGREYLYKALRKPNLDKNKIKDIDTAAGYMSSHTDDRVSMQMSLSKLGFVHKVSFSDYVDVINKLNPLKNSLSYLFNVLNIASILVMIFVNAQAGVLALIASLLASTAYYFKKKPEAGRYFIALSQISRMVRTGKDIEKKRKSFSDMPDELKGVLNNIERDTDIIYPSIKNDWLLPDTGANSSIVEVIMNYLRMFTHVDLIHYNRAIKQIKGKSKNVLALMNNLGYLELVICTASFRKAIKKYSYPEFIEDENQGINVEGIYHPLIKDAVPNDISNAKNVLITGSNASGKSTFLKSIALNVILSQSIATSVSEKYSAPIYKLYSSMSLRDDYKTKGSYYMVEIRALKRIVDAAQSSNIPVLAIVDEVLRGTNTIERIAAGSSILEYLKNENTNTFAATHDIEITDILKGSYSNYHFRESFNEDGDIEFTYKLQNGAATTRNAIVLLGTLGFDDKIIDKANNRAKEFMDTGIWK